MKETEFKNKKNIKENPLVSFCLLTYNQEDFISEALQGAFNQSYSPLEIIISDDFSTDKTREKINRIVKEYKGDHEIKINFNNHNLGLAENFNKSVLKIANGEFIVLAAGDDISLPERVSKSVDFLLSHPDCYIADYNVDFIDEEGRIEPGILKKEDVCFRLSDLFEGNLRGVRGCSRVYRRELLDTFGPLNSNCPTEDSPSVWRGLIMGEVWTLKEKLVLYRRHNSSISSPSNMVKLNIKQIVDQYNADIDKASQLGILSQDLYNRLLKYSKKNYRLRKYERNKKVLSFFLKRLLNLFNKN